MKNALFSKLSFFLFPLHFQSHLSSHFLNSISLSMDLPDIELDPQLKYWVLLPISFVMVLVGLLRSNITVMMQPNPKLEPFRKIREK